VKKKSFLFLCAWGIFLLSVTVAEAQTKIYTVSPCEFIPEQWAEKQIKVWNWGTYFLRQDTSTEPWYYAPVHLPDNVIIKYVKIHFYDNYDHQFINVKLRRANKYDKSSQVIYDVTSLGGFSTPVRHEIDTTPENPAFTKTNLSVFNYYLMLNMSSYGTGLQLVGVTIGYQ
jgi:hypothetical protein